MSTMTIDDMIADYVKASAQLGRHVRAIEEGLLIRSRGKDPAEETRHWLETLKRHRSEYDAIVETLRNRAVRP